MAVGRNRNKIYAVAVATFLVTVWVIAFTSPCLDYEADLGQDWIRIYRSLSLHVGICLYFCVGEAPTPSKHEIRRRSRSRRKSLAPQEVRCRMEGPRPTRAAGVPDLRDRRPCISMAGMPNGMSPLLRHGQRAIPTWRPDDQAGPGCRRPRSFSAGVKGGPGETIASQLSGRCLVCVEGHEDA